MTFDRSIGALKMRPWMWNPDVSATWTAFIHRISVRTCIFGVVPLWKEQWQMKFFFFDYVY